jgi:hypothetical protein
VIDDGITHPFALSTNASWLQPLNSEIHNMSLFTLGCERIAESICRLYIEDNVDGKITGNFTCNELHNVRGEKVIFALEMESQENGSYSCLMLIESFVFESTSNVSHLSVRRAFGNTCIVVIEGCFPPCCGSTGTITRVTFGQFRYWPDGIEQCYKINISMAEGDAIAIYDDNLLPSVTVRVTDMQNSHINLSLMNSDLDNLQYCFKTCTKTIDIGRDLTTLNYTKGCFSVNVTLVFQKPMDLQTMLTSYRPYFTYCMEKISDNEMHIECVGFNPEDKNIHEKIVLEISHSGDCEADYSLKFGTPETVPCTDKRCQKVESFNVKLCLTLCIDNVAVNDDAVSLCVSYFLFHKSDRNSSSQT